MADTTEPASQDQAVTISLAAKLDTAAAQVLHAELLSHEGAPVHLDGADVTMLGGRCLDVLLAAQKHWSDSEKPLSVTNPSDALLRDLATYGTSLDALTAGGTQ